MSKKKLVFRVGSGLAVTGLALSVGAGCPKSGGDGPIMVNPAPPPMTTGEEIPEPEPPAPPVNVNTVESPPPMEADAGNSPDAALPGKPAVEADAGPPKREPKKIPIRVNSPPPSMLEAGIDE